MENSTYFGDDYPDEHLFRCVLVVNGLFEPEFGRTEYKTLEEGTRRYRNDKPSISRSPSKRYRRTIAGSSRNEILQEKQAPIVHDKERNGSVIRNNNNVTIVHVGSQPQQVYQQTNNGHLHLNGSVAAANTNGTLRQSNKGFVSNGTTLILPPNHSVKRGLPSSSGDGIKTDDDGGFREAPALYARSSSSTAPAKYASNAANHVRLDAGENATPYPVNGLSYRTMPERIPTGAVDTTVMTSPVHLVSSSNVTRPRKELVLPSDSNGNGLSLSSLTCIRIKPDSDGKFGFNVRGGIDLNLPVIVTRVAPNTPADLAVPRLHEGDQVLSINGRETATLTHDEVVILIKSSRETRSGELVLYVRPNIYNGGDEQEPEFQYIPDTPRAPNGHSGNPLQESILLLADGLKTNNAMLHFEQLYRKNPKMSMKDAEMPMNNARNRYKDVLPYDATRVFLQHNESGSDYINANFVKMEIPTSGIVNRYIAAQGPLPHTGSDFWQMIWEQQSTLVVMLTSLVEQGRIKCHQYWPNLYETSEYGPLQVTCMKEQAQDCFAFRELSLIHTETNEERHITHMQYIAWPDHGVPDDASDFLEFVIRVRQHRVGMGEPTVIHCSAGIGRTGVLILMETAMCLIEANEPVYPLDIVRTMRDQRAMLIQTTSQYKFVCEAILRVFNDGLVKPLDDYRK
ncbi:hypothetical protein RvY_10243-2 [Ramazzottius varieornatus]|uniref:Tyrosine-protein phosphatase n=1 Tax=Ramazzottius varieornatus TaxID=947166 RepID=A0A1D1VC49_RAMVA|nr:hypothetical protein RvY_10243-2 [Ramazzottius varieornatus]